MFFGASFLQGILLNKFLNKFWYFLDFLIIFFLIKIKLCQQKVEVRFSTFKEAQSISGKSSTPNTRTSWWRLVFETSKLRISKKKSDPWRAIEFLGGFSGKNVKSRFLPCHHLWMTPKGVSWFDFFSVGVLTIG
jgi:hypothetical protein